MITIEVNNSFSRIKGYTAEQYRQLRKLLSYSTDPSAAYYMGGFTRVKYLLDKQGNFPTGLLNRVVNHLITTASPPRLIDLRKVPKSKPNLGSFHPKLGFTPYPDQLDAVEKAIMACRMGIQMPTGTGKSVVIDLLIRRLNVRTLVVVPTLELKRQLSATLKHHKNVVVENIDSNALQGRTHFDCLIIDEVHHAASKTYQRLNKSQWQGIYYRFFLTATYFRNQEHESLIFEGLAGQVGFKLGIQDSVKKGYIVPVEAYYIDMSKRSTDAYTWQQVYSELVVNNEARNELLGRLLRVLNAGKHPTLCLVKEIAHGAILERLTGIPFANGQDDNTRGYIDQFNAGKIKALIGTVGILGEGIDTKPCEYVIIAGLGKAKSSFMQAVGRGVRCYPGKNSAKIILFRDRSHRFTLRHYNAQSKILVEEYGIKPIKLDL